MAGQIIGVNKSSLWLAWKEIRAELRNASVRDVIDFLDYDIEPKRMDWAFIAPHIIRGLRT